VVACTRVCRPTTGTSYCGALVVPDEIKAENGAPSESKFLFFSLDQIQRSRSLFCATIVPTEGGRIVHHNTTEDIPPRPRIHLAVVESSPLFVLHSGASITC
jgi:hypothetical protein